MTIFCLTIDFILRHFKDHPDNIVINNQQFTAYADDLVLFGSCRKNIISKVNELVKMVDKIHLKFKPAKCGYFAMKNPTDVRIYGEQIPTVDKDNTYTYLGVPLGSPKGHTIKQILDNNVVDFNLIAASVLQYYTLHKK